MTFKELLERYRKGIASSAEREEVERELEKYEALTEHFLGEEPLEAETETSDAELKKIRKGMKKRNLWIVAAAVLIACGVVSAGVYLEPIISKAVWYDPTEEGLQQFAYDIDCHIAVLTELTMPEVQMEQVWIEERGHGNYDLDVTRRDYSSGETDYSYGTVQKGKITMHQDFYQPSVMNVFSRGTYGMMSRPEPDGIIKDRETAKAILQELPEYIRAEAYVSLAEDWSMEELEAFRKTVETDSGWLGWVAVRNAPLSEQRLPLVGFQAMSGGLIYDELDQSYPYYEISEHEEEPLAQVWTEHFKSLLRYSVEHRAFYQRFQRDIGNHGDKCEEVLDYVEKNGVKTYGFVYYGTPSDLLRVLEQEGVEGIYISDASVQIPDLS